VVVVEVEAVEVVTADVDVDGAVELDDELAGTVVVATEEVEAALLVVDSPTVVVVDDGVVELDDELAGTVVVATEDVEAALLVVDPPTVVVVVATDVVEFELDDVEELDVIVSVWNSKEYTCCKILLLFA